MGVIEGTYYENMISVLQVWAAVGTKTVNGRVDMTQATIKSVVPTPESVRTNRKVPRFVSLPGPQTPAKSGGGKKGGDSGS